MMRNKFNEVIEKLKKEGKHSTIEWTPEQWKEWNDEMEKIQRESRRKLALSQIEASKIILY